MSSYGKDLYADKVVSETIVATADARFFGGFQPMMNYTFKEFADTAGGATVSITTDTEYFVAKVAVGTGGGAATDSQTVTITLNAGIDLWGANPTHVPMVSVVFLDTVHQQVAMSGKDQAITDGNHIVIHRQEVGAGNNVAGDMWAYVRLIAVAQKKENP